MDAPTITQDHVQRLIEARKAHDQSGLETYDEVVREVAGRIDASGSVGKSEVGALVLWKRLRADTKWARKFMAVPESDVRAVTQKTVAAARDQSMSLADAGRQARLTLGDLPGFGSGDALASAVIFVCAPKRMAVYDRRAHRGLQELIDMDMGRKPGRYGRYMGRVADLADAVNASDVPGRWIPRDVDLALYMIGGPKGE